MKLSINLCLLATTHPGGLAKKKSRPHLPVKPLPHHQAGVARGLVHLVLEYVEVVGGCHGDDVLGGVPGRVQDLLGEVQAVHADVVLPPLAPGAHAARLEHGPGLAALPRRLQGHVPLGVPVEHPEEVVVGAGHDHTGERGRERERGGG